MKSIALLVIVLFASITPLNVMARTDAMKKRCDDCHTMHNSQGGLTVTASAPEALLNASCYGCHSNAIDGLANGANRIPYVWQTNPAPPTDATYTSQTLAGGDFYFAAMPGGDAKVHNVEGIAPQVARTAPGGTEFFDAARPLNCAGANGCHGDRSVSNEILAMSRAHHGDDGTTMDGNTVATSYRFLLGVVGYEAPDWELNPTTAVHNQYKGVVRANDTPSPSTISNLCASCHGDFHNNSSGAGAGVSDGPMTNPWIRHPVDFGMGSLSGEYDGYGGAGVNDYVVNTPLASVDVSAPKVTGLTADADTIIMCISCHRSHGSPYDSILRWDYQNWPGGGYNGCGDCHTEKN